MVYIVNDGGQIVSCGSRDNNLSCACLDVSLGFCLRGVEAGALQNNVYLQLSPGKICGVSLFVNFDGLAVNRDGACFLIRGNSVSQSVLALRRIIFYEYTVPGEIYVKLCLLSSVIFPMVSASLPD